MSDVAPVQESQRIKSLDVVRGLALLGILAVNAAFFAAPFQATQNPLLPPIAIDESTLWSWFVMHVFFEFKMITLFSLLFGASIYLVGGERTDLERGAVLRRRLFWLLVFGLIHGALIWYGDILLTYAVTGFLVLFARSWRPLTLMIAGVVVFALSVALIWGMSTMLQSASPEQLAELRNEMWTPPAEEIERTIAAFQSGLIGAQQENFNAWLETTAFMVLFVVRTAGIMMIGMALFKWGFFSGRSPNWIYGALTALGAAALVLVAWQAWINWQAGFDFAHMAGAGTFANTTLSPFISLMYASMLVLLVKAGALRLLTDALAAVGRMAFSNYIAQSLIMTTIFYGGRGFGQFGEFSRPELWVVVLVVWALELIWSPLWLARFEMGPLEWVWRRLSYGRPVVIAKPAAA